jgi:hypothetical protein
MSDNHGRVRARAAIPIKPPSGRHSRKRLNPDRKPRTALERWRASFGVEISPSGRNA